jgi:hypothetical protein
LNYLNIAAYLLNVVITYGIGVGGFFDLPTNGDLSKKYQTLVTPVGWAFGTSHRVGLTRRSTTIGTAASRLFF